MDAITEATSLEQVVSAINQAADGHGVDYFGGTDMRSAEKMAGQYALDAVTSSDYPEVNEENIAGHLEILEQAGAHFDPSGAVALALKMHHAE